MLPDLAGIEALHAVVKYGGFARAAEHLNKVQSAVSHQIRKLEEQLGVTLFDREGYRVKLTAAGEIVLAEGRRLLAQAEQLSSVAKRFSQGWESTLHIVMDGILPLTPVLAALKAFAVEDVPTRVQMQVGYLRGVQRRFEQDEADLMLTVQYAHDPYLREESLPGFDCILCVSREHALAGVREVALVELQRQVELSVQHSDEEQRDDRRLFGCERAFYLSSFEAKKEALLQGVGFGWMPDFLVRDELSAGTLQELNYVDGSRYRVAPCLVHRNDRGLGLAGQRFVALLREGSSPS